MRKLYSLTFKQTELFSLLCVVIYYIQNSITDVYNLD